MQGIKLLSIGVLFFFIGCGSVKQEIKQQELDVKSIVKEDTENYVEVEAESMVAVVKGNLLATKDQSLMAAQRTALEKSLGVYITGQTVVSNAAVIEENIFSRTVGYIKEFKVLSEKEEDGFYKTKIYAKVRLADVKKDLDALGLLIKTKKVGNPRVMVVLDEEIDGVVSTSANAETVLITKLLDKGYKVVDKAQTEKLNADEKAKLTSLVDGKEIASIASKFNADVIITGKVTSRFNTDQDLSGFISYLANINAKVIKSATGEVILTSSNNGAGIDITKENSAVKAIQKVSESFGKNIIPQIATKLYEEANVVVSAIGIKTINELEDFNKILKGFDGVSGTNVRSYEKNEAKIELDLKYGNAQTIASKLEAVSSIKIVVKEVAGYSISAEISK